MLQTRVSRELCPSALTFPRASLTRTQETQLSVTSRRTLLSAGKFPFYLLSAIVFVSMCSHVEPITAFPGSPALTSTTAELRPWGRTACKCLTWGHFSCGDSFC